MRTKAADLTKRDYQETLEKTKHFQNTLIHLQYEGKASRGKNVARIRKITGYFDHQVKKHIKQEHIIFPYLKSHIPRLESLLFVLRTEHEDLKKNLFLFRSQLQSFVRNKKTRTQKGFIGKLKERGTYLIYLLQRHLAEENGLLYPAADRELSPGEKTELIRRIKALGNGSRYF